MITYHYFYDHFPVRKLLVITRRLQKKVNYFTAFTVIYLLHYEETKVLESWVGVSQGLVVFATGQAARMTRFATRIWG